MLEMRKGHFFGDTNLKLDLGGITVTKTVYTHDYVDWHCHENAYFTFILCGGLIETDKKNTFRCGPGALLFHYWEEAHCNIKPPEFTQGFHIEIHKSWFDRLQLPQRELGGSFRLYDPASVIGFYTMAREASLRDSASQLAIESQLVNVLTRMSQINEKPITAKPAWVKQLRDILHEEHDEVHSLTVLAARLDIHPVHLSRDFQKHFNSSFGEYIRSIKIQNSLALLQNPSMSLTEIAFACGFADQSHFLRCFKSHTGIKPSQFRKSFLG